MGESLVKRNNKMIYRYALTDKVNSLVLPDNVTNLRVLVSSTDGQINLYADVETAQSNSKITFEVCYTGDLSPVGNFIGSGFIGHKVYHVYEVVGQINAAVLERCLVFEYPDSNSGQLVERIVFDYIVEDDCIKGYDQFRNGDFRQFKIDGIRNGLIMFDRRSR